MSKNVQPEDHGVHQRGAASAQLALEPLVMEGIWDCTGRAGMAPRVLGIVRGVAIARDKYDRLEKRHMWLERTDAHVGRLREGKCPCSLLKVQTFYLRG